MLGETKHTDLEDILKLIDLAVLLGGGKKNLSKYVIKGENRKGTSQ